MNLQRLVCTLFMMMALAGCGGGGGGVPLIPVPPPADPVQPVPPPADLVQPVPPPADLVQPVPPPADPVQLPQDQEALRYAALLQVLQSNSGTKQELGTGFRVDEGRVIATDRLGAFDEQRMDFKEGGLDSHVPWQSYTSTRASTTVVSVTNQESVRDLSYIDFGYWMEEMEEGVAPDNRITTDVGLYSFGSDGTYPVNEVTGYVGYLGPATGLYVDTRDQSHGRFFAAADLTAYFGIEEGIIVSNVAISHSISGRLYDFRNNEGGMGSEWAVDFNRIGMNVGGVYDAAAGTFSGGTTTGGGSWQGAFYPPSGSDFFPTTPTDWDRPYYISGTFNAHIESVGHIAGAWLGENKESGRGW